MKERNRQILVLESYEGLGQLFSAIAEEVNPNLKVKVAKNLEEALQKLATVEFGLVLANAKVNPFAPTDCVQLAKEVKKTWPDTYVCAYSNQKGLPLPGELTAFQFPEEVVSCKSIDGKIGFEPKSIRYLLVALYQPQDNSAP